MQEMTTEQFIAALQTLAELSCNSLSSAKVFHREQKAQGIIAEMNNEANGIDIVLRWYVMEELEHLGVIFPTTMARKYLRKHHGGASCKR